MGFDHGYEECDEMNSTYFARGFNPAGANPCKPGDFEQSNRQLSAAVVADVITVIQAVIAALPASARDSLRKAAS